MTDVSGTDQEKLYLCILKLLKKGSNNEFEILQELCKEISDDLPDLKIYNDNTSSSTSDVDDEAKKQLNTLVEKGRQDLADYTPVETEGDGSCLFRALSLLCFGHQNRHRELRVRCVIDMATYSEYYYDSGILQKKRNESNAISNRSRESMKKSNAVKNEKSENGSAHDVSEFEKSEDSTENGSTEETDENNQPSGNDPLVVDFKKSVCETCDPTAYTGFWEIQALGVILNRKIKIVCSSRDERELEKLEKAYGVDVGSEPPLTIMFLLDDKHFVPLIRKEVKEEEDSGCGDQSLNDSKDENATPLETKVKKVKDSGLGDSLLNKSTEKDTPPLDESTTKKARDKASNDAKVKNEPNKNIEDIEQEHFQPSCTSTPKKTPKNKALVQESDDDGRVDITSGDNLDDVLDKLNDLLGVDYNIKANLRRNNLSIKTLKSLTGPYQMADSKILGILKNKTVMFVSRLIEVQFQIKWNTEDGMPQQFNFYEFCNVEKQTAAKHGKKGPGKTVHLKYDPRRAHVFTELYRKAVVMSKAECEQTFCRGKNIDFCPDAYVRVRGSWARICFSRKTCEKVTLKRFKSDFSWMHESLRKFVSEAEKLEITLKPDAKEEENYSIVTKAIEKPTLYWAVLQDKDFRSGDHLMLHEIGKTQVYVGKANGGIMRRWIQDADNHSKQMMTCAHNIVRMKCNSFDETRLVGIQLVDARLLLAKIRKEKEERAVIFLIQTFDNSDDLVKGEKRHREGKKIGSEKKNIVSCNDFKDTWTPKKMQYGMNKL